MTTKKQEKEMKTTIARAVAAMAQRPPSVDRPLGGVNIQEVVDLIGRLYPDFEIAGDSENISIGVRGPTATILKFPKRD